MEIQFVDLAAQQERLGESLGRAIADVLREGHYVMGRQVRELEAALSMFCGARHAVSCANGTDALQLALMALGAGRGDAVFVPAFTFAATAEVAPLVNATPYFVDVDRRTFNMDAESLKRSIGNAKDLGLRPFCIVPVDLFGLAADYDALIAVARENDVRVVGDSAQGFGADYKGRRTGTICDITATSFFPAKPLGCYGDGGAVFTNNGELATLLDSLRLHGKGTDKYHNERIGMNSRLDTIQAAILLEKLAIYPDELESRRKIAKRYDDALSGRLETPYVPDGLKSVWAQYTIKTRSPAERAVIQNAAKRAGVPTMVYYPVPLHKQTAFDSFPADPNGLPISEDLAGRVLSLPMHPYLEAEVQDRVIDVITSAAAGA